MTLVAERLVQVLNGIAHEARACGREPSAVRLIAVSKTKPASMIREAFAAGQRDFGENYVQELLAKAEELRDLSGIRWHMIGHLQRNKARHVVRAAHVVHTVDSAALARELNARLSAEGRCLPVLIEVNIAGEASKSGCSPDEAATLCREIGELDFLQLRGLMAVPPATADPSASRPHFERLAQLRDSLGGAELLPELSMGMSDDMSEAIRAGATWVRVGTAVFGARERRG